MVHPSRGALAHLAQTAKGAGRTANLAEIDAGRRDASIGQNSAYKAAKCKAVCQLTKIQAIVITIEIIM
jgi:hypothetical protein